MAVLAQPAPQLMERARNSGQGVETLCRHAHISVSLPSDLGDSLFPACHDLMLGCAPWEPSKSSPTSLMASGNGLSRKRAFLPRDTSEMSISLTGIVHTLVPDSAEVYTALDAAAVLLVHCSPSRPPAFTSPQQGLAIRLSFCSPSL